MWSRTFVHDHMKSVVCRAPKTVSGNLYVIFGLWNHGPTLSRRILIRSLHTLTRFWVESSLYASWTLISWLFESLRTRHDHKRMAKPRWNDLSKKKVPRVLDKSKALIIAEKQCYIARINICYGKPPYRDVFLRLSGCWASLTLLVVSSTARGWVSCLPTITIAHQFDPITSLDRTEGHHIPETVFAKERQFEEEGTGGSWETAAWFWRVNSAKRAMVTSIGLALPIFPLNLYHRYLTGCSLSIFHLILNRFSVVHGITTRIMGALSLTSW